ncbi:UPF0223 family protein [Leuconostoc citreum]|jgi:uncharacterized protein YktA (UPF0223 family)|uniref:Uncharacterized protein n=2 Tax=Leuconostoc citreum TaxID=33964 RepID=B1MZG3_LEUCK|nr:UPF0223 family protein [Leuconostoc citreum]ACA82915.1 Uncharacterised protein family (UPF0223) superfamily [Leuconostoc citreum KM20]KAF0261118.1 hypothetical protein CRI81_02755 [Leuconostoc citreum]MBA5938310.1 UPF0223 family protein [Leuconostoc citreum]MCJ2166813.1 UPF0223 family protein [Leuconostoc citreum]MCK8605486.1 UPF0223 family protein [Leuconostoc citreum]
MSENYTLPIDSNWTIDDIVTVSAFVDKVLQVYENGVLKVTLLAQYDKFRQVIPSKSEQKQFDRNFEQQTGFSIYRTIKLAQATTKDRIKV